MLILLAALVLAQAPSVDWTALTAKVREAAEAGDSTQIKAARAAALKTVVSPAPGVPPALAHYTLAYTDYRLATDQRLGNAECREFADEAEQHLRTAIRLNDKFADAHALLASVIGLKIAWSATVAAKMTLGPDSGAEMDRAKALEPDNPRVWILDGIGFLHRPAEYGGDPKEAERLFRRAAEKLDAARNDPWPNWGRFDAHAWLGQALAARGDVGGARAEYDKALQIAPESGWVKYILIPALGGKIVE